MNAPPGPTDLQFLPATEESVRRGRLGTLSFNLDGLHLSGVQIRRSAKNGRVYLSLRYAEVRPGDDDARITLEAQVFAALGFKSGEGAT